MPKPKRYVTALAQRASKDINALYATARWRYRLYEHLRNHKVPHDTALALARDHDSSGRFQWGRR